MGATRTPVWINTEEKSNAERILLGAMLREPYKLADHMAGLVQPALATSGRYAAAFAEIFNQFSTRGTYSAATVATRTANNDLYQVAAENPDIDLSWAADNWWAVYRVWAEVQAFTFAQAPDVSVLGADAMRAKIEEVREMLGANGVIKLKDHREEFAETSLAKLEGKEPDCKAKPSIQAVREFIKAYLPGYLTIVAGRPGMGKTQYLAGELSEFINAGANGLLFSLEMSGADLLRRLMGIRHGVNPFAEWSKLSDEEKGNVQRAIHEVATLNTRIIDDVFNVSEIESIAAAAYYRGELDFIMVDYLQLAIVGGRTSGNPEETISKISGAFVRMAKRFNVPVIALSQLSRAVEIRGGSKRPQLSDLRGSGSIEQDAAIVKFLFRPEYYDILEDEAGNSTKGVGEVIIAKHRNGPTGTVICRYDPVRGYRDPKPQQPFSPVAPGFDTVDYSEARPKSGEDIPF
jgi:replicative DNA helicase